MGLIGHLHDMLLAALGQRETVWFPVVKGNHIVIAQFDRKNFNRAKIGTRIRLHGGGWVEKFADESWHQWRFIPPDVPAVQAEVLPPLKQMPRLGERLKLLGDGARQIRS